MKKLVAAMLIALAGLSATPAAAQSNDLRQFAGIWANPKNTVHVRVHSCGASLCGVVDWANAEAVGLARDHGTANLLGMQLFRSLNPQGEGVYAGDIFVPDIGRSVSGTMRAGGPNSVIVRGCLLLGRFLCRTQTWIRVG